MTASESSIQASRGLSRSMKSFLLMTTTWTRPSATQSALRSFPATYACPCLRAVSQMGCCYRHTCAWRSSQEHLQCITASVCTALSGTLPPDTPKPGTDAQKLQVSSHHFVVCITQLGSCSMASACCAATWAKRLEIVSFCTCDNSTLSHKVATPKLGNLSPASWG